MNKVVLQTKMFFPIILSTASKIFELWTIESSFGEIKWTLYLPDLSISFGNFFSNNSISFLASNASLLDKTSIGDI